MIGLQFENLVLNNRYWIHESLHLKPDDIGNENRYLQRKTNRAPGCQIDYLIQTRFRTVYVCEIKFSKNPINFSFVKEVEAKIKALKYPLGFSCRPVLIV